MQLTMATPKRPTMRTDDTPAGRHGDDPAPPDSPPATVRLSADTIVAAAMTVMTSNGEITYRALAEELGVDPSAPYRYFRNRAELVHAVFNEFTRGLATGFTPSDDWRRDAHELARRTVELYLSNPAAARLLLEVDEFIPELLDYVRLAASVLARSGAPERACFEAFHAIEMAVLGSVVHNTARFPHHVLAQRAYFHAVGTFDVDALYPDDHDLEVEAMGTTLLAIDLILDWLAAQGQADPAP